MDNNPLLGILGFWERARFWSDYGTNTFLPLALLDSVFTLMGAPKFPVVLETMLTASFLVATGSLFASIIANWRIRALENALGIEHEDD